MAKKNESTGLPELKADLKAKTFRRLYFFHGEEIFLLRYYLEQMKKQLIDEVTESFNFHRMNGENFDIRSFSDAVENLPMMSDTTFVQVDDIDLFKLPESDREKLSEILFDIPEYCTVVFTYETAVYHPDKRYAKLYAAVTEHGFAVEFAKQDQRDLVAWIGRHFSARGKQIDPNLCVYLIELTDGTMTSLSGEISKICSYSGADRICKSDIDAVVEPVLDAVIYQMTDLMSQKKFPEALLKVQQLWKMQEEPLMILGAIGSHFRRASAARTLIDQGKGTSELMKLYGIREYPAKKAMECARKFSPDFFARSAQWVLETDYKIKTSYDDPQRLVEVLILQLSVEARK